MTIKFIDKYVSADLAGLLSQDASFTILSPDSSTGEFVWNAGNRNLILGKISGNIDNAGTPLASLEVKLDFENLPSFCRGYLIVENSSTTQYTLTKSASETGVEWKGDYVCYSNERNIFEFLFEGGVVLWRSFNKIAFTTLATFENGTVTLQVNSVTGVDDGDPSTPYLTIEHAIRQMREHIPYSNAFPSPGGGFANDRVISVLFELTGTFNEAVSLHFSNDYAIRFLGMGANPADTLIYGDANEAALSLNTNAECRFENLSIDSPFMGVNLINSRMVRFTNCKVHIRGTAQKNIFYAIDYCSFQISGTLEISGLIRSIINCNNYSSAKCTATLKSPDATIGFTDAFITANTYSFVDASTVQLDPALTLEGVAVDANEIATTVLLPTPFSNLT